MRRDILAAEYYILQFHVLPQRDHRNMVSLFLNCTDHNVANKLWKKKYFESKNCLVKNLTLVLKFISHEKTCVAKIIGLILN